MDIEGVHESQGENARELVQQACEVWVRRLIDHSRNNSLLFYRDLKVSTLDLTNSASTLERLLNGKQVRIDHFVADMNHEKNQSFQDSKESQKERRREIQQCLLTIQRKASANLEKKRIRNTISSPWYGQLARGGWWPSVLRAGLADTCSFSESKSNR